MEVIRGTVSALRHGKTVLYKKETGTSTVRAAVFRIGEQPCKIVSTEPIVIEDGDDIRLAGTRRADNVFLALAHRNLTRRTEGHEDWATRLVLTVLLVAAGIWMGNVMLGEGYALVVGLALLGAGALMALRSVQVIMAIIALRR